MNPAVCPVTPLPQIPRSEWNAHAKYPSQVLLLGSHQNFRRLGSILVEAARREGSAEPGNLSVLEHTFFSWQSAMLSHEGYEEKKLYPYLVHRYGVDVTSLQEGHHSLDRLRRDARVAFDEYQPPLVADALAAFQKQLEAHLDEEEELVIPLLLELSSQEFRDLTGNSITQLLSAEVGCTC